MYKYEGVHVTVQNIESTRLQIGNYYTKWLGDLRRSLK